MLTFCKLFKSPDYTISLRKMTKRRRKSKSAKNENSTPKKPRKFFVQIERDPNVQAARQELPVCLHEQEIIEAIHEHDVVLITGATGTGKTTQVPQFLVEDGFGHHESPGTTGMIAVTQPRRVAAKTCAARVARELNTKLGGDGLVGYHVRHDSQLGDNVRVKFSTDGILLREVENDLMLRRYSAIIIDEAHERSLNTDLLLSFLSRSVIMRRQKHDQFGYLKLIVMSATLDVDGILSGQNPLFPNPPVISVPARQFPITIHFAKRTYDDYVEEAFRKVAQIHRRLPPGGILIFLSGREEIERLCTKLRDEFGNRKIQIDLSAPQPQSQHTLPAEDQTNEVKQSESIPTATTKDDDDNRNRKPSTSVHLRLQVLPFYSLLPEPQQRRVFQHKSEDAQHTRRVIVATNIAETSVTVPGIVYVVDSGRAKERVYKGQGCGRLSAYEVGWISQASAEQRAGRAGRISAGHCYRLFSSAVYDQQFAKFRTPEILRVPADNVVLRLRAMGILHIQKFPFATKPPLQQLLHAERLLIKLGALIDQSTSSPSSVKGVLLGVTRIGRMLADLPVEPRLGRLLLAAGRLDNDVSDSADDNDDNNDLENTVALACRLGGILSVGTVLHRADNPTAKAARTKLRHVKSDLITELAAVCAVEHCGMQAQATGLNTTAMRALCSTLNLHTKCVLEAIAIAKQVEREVGTLSHNKTMKPPNARTLQQLLRSVVAGFGDQIAKRMSRNEAAAVGVMPKLMSRAFVTAVTNTPVFIEGGSSVRIERDTKFVCFTSLVEVEVKQNNSSDQDDQHDDYDDNNSDNEAHTIGDDTGDNKEDGDSEKQAKTDALVGTENSIQVKKRIKKRKIANVTGGASNTVKRIVMRGLSIVDPRWIIEHSQGMCDMKIDEDSKTEYHSSMESITENVCVTYKGRGWYLGRKRVPVQKINELCSSSGSGIIMTDERRMQHAQCFAKALIDGKVRPCIKFSRAHGKVDIFYSRLAGLLQRWDLCSVQSLVRALLPSLNASSCGREIIECLEICCHMKYREESSQSWRKGLQMLMKEKIDSDQRNNADVKGNVFNVNQAHEVDND